MRKLYVTFFCLLIPFFSFSQLFEESESLYDHLSQVNVQWGKQVPSSENFSAPVNFLEHETRIQAHLLLVVQTLRNRPADHLSSEQKNKRDQLLNDLEDYTLAGQFPLNSRHQHTQIPYFIDHEGTACAVGHLLRESGYEGFANQIKTEMNNAYLLEMPYAEIPAWADAHGFTVDELAWIQPGYQNPMPWAAFEGGTNGTITAMHTVSNQVTRHVYIGGEFTNAGGVSSTGIARFDGSTNTWTDLGAVFSGDIKCLFYHNSHLYVGGYFPIAGGYRNLAILQPNGTWNMEQVYEGTINCLEVFDGKLYAGGTLNHSGGMLVNHVLEMDPGSGLWTSPGGGVDGEVFDLHAWNGKLYAAGDFTTANGGTEANYVAVYDGNNWQGLQENDSIVRPAAPLFALADLDGKLYAGGAFEANGSRVPGLWNWQNGDWTAIFDDDPMLHPNPEIYALTAYHGAVYVGGRMVIPSPGVGYFGSNIGVIRDLQSSYALEAAGGFDSTVFAMGEFTDRLLAGGAFEMNYNVSGLNHLVDVWNPVMSVEPGMARERLKVYPNPIASDFEVKLNVPVANGSLNVRIYSPEGKEMQADFDRSGQVLRFTQPDWPAGVYFLSVFEDETLLGTANLLVR